MIFSSITFLFLYLPIVFIAYLIMPSVKAKNILLTIASLIFYAWGEPVYVVLMMISVFFNWKIGLLMEKDIQKKNRLLILALIFNIGILFYFKYYAFFIEIINTTVGISLEIPNIKMPIGVSFFTFQALSYVYDVKRNDTQAQKSYMNLLLYISLFPQLIAGPIVRYADLDRQIKKRQINIDKIAKGIQRFIIGLTKKIMIANNMAMIVDVIFSFHPSEFNSITAWVGAICYLFQIYFDFSGYSDMAIGIGSMLGFEFRENFNYPLMATSIKDFWRRWHISLSTWFREYLYIPLGGNRKGIKRTYINQMIVFLATGLWHGANLTFIVWGVLHGIMLIFENKGIIPLKWVKFKALKHLYTLVVVIVLFVIFRAENIEYGIEYIKVMFLGHTIDVNKYNMMLEMMTPFICFIMLIAAISATDVLNIFKRRIGLDKDLMSIKGQTVEIIGYVITIIFFIMNVLALASDAYNPFIYFRF